MSELPKGWERVPLGKYIKLKNGFAFKSKDFVSKAGNTYPVIRISDIQNGKVSTEENAHVLEDIANFKFAIDKGDLLIAMSGATTGKTGVYTGQEVALQNQRVGNLKLVNSTTSCPRYRNYLIASLKQEIIKKAYGAAQPNISAKELESIEVNIAPFEEQKRIADKLDSVLAKVEAAQARLDKIPAILKRFRQSVLAAATSGDLTKEWRKENLLTRIERIEGIFELNFDVIEKSNIPANWQYVALGNFAKCSRGKFSVRPRNDPSCFDGKYPFIQIGDLPKEGGAIVNHKQTLNEKGFSVSREFKTGTVVIAIVGATIANTGITTYPVCFPDSLIGINSPSDIENVYIDYVLRAFKEDIKRVSYAGGGQPNIKLTTINPLPIPLPPKTEIEEIVTRVEALFEHSNTVEKQYYVAKARLDKLTQSILKKAFEGELFNDSVHLENSITAQVNKLEAV